MNISYSTSSDLYNKIASNGNSYISSYHKKVREADTNVQDLQEDIESFRNNLRKLKNYDSDSVTRSKLQKNLEKFVDSYNELKDSAKNITDKELAKSLAKLEDFMEENKKSLKKLGLKESNGKWTFDEETFEEAEDKDIIAICEGTDSVFNQMDKLMRRLEKKADEEEYQMVLRNFHSVAKYSEEEMWQASSANYIHGVIEGLQKADTEVQNYEASSGDSSENVTQGFDRFVVGYNNVLKVSVDSINSYIGYMQDITKENETALNKVGITIEDDGTLEYSSSATIDDDYKQAYATLFGENAAYGTLMKTYAKNIFNTMMRTESLGITINTYA